MIHYHYQLSCTLSEYFEKKKANMSNYDYFMKIISASYRLCCEYSCKRVSQKSPVSFASHCGRSYEMLLWYTDLNIH